MVGLSNFCRYKCRLLTLFLFVGKPLFASDEATQDIYFNTHYQPWFTGSIVTPSAYTVQPGHVNVQPSLFFTTNTGTYSPHWHVDGGANFYIATLRVQGKVGICSWMDFQFTTQAFYKETIGSGAFSFGDLPIILNFQLLGSQMKDPWPAIKLGIRTNFPCGKYKQLSASKHKTDVGGSGNWEPGPVLSFTKLWQIYQIHYLQARFSMYYRFRTPVHVKGFNTYGGAPDTRGIVYPGNEFFASGSIQYNFTQRWVFACDIVYVHQNRTTFRGRLGTLSDGTPSTVSKLSTEQFSLAPALEYNLNKNLGFLGGVWFTFAGRNATQFTSGVLSFNAYF